MQPFEDFMASGAHEFGVYDVTEAEVLEFAEQYDPQWFHTDPERTKPESMYGGVIASGWHTTAMTVRLLVDGSLDDSTALDAKDVDELHWWRPVYPGDTFAMGNEVLGTTAETDSRGLVKIWATTHAECKPGEVKKVCSFASYVMFARRDDDAE